MSKSTEFSTGFNLASVTTYQSGIVQAQVHRKLKQNTNAYLKPYNLTMMEWFALGLVYDAANDGLRLTDMASALQTTLPYMTNLVNHLEAKRLVERIDHRSDSRAKLVRLSPGTDKFCEEIEAYLRDRLRDFIYAKISRQDFQAYIKVLYQLSK